MTDNEATVAVPVSLIERAYEQSGNKISESLGLIYELAHPKPDPRRLRVVDLDALTQGFKREWVNAYDIEAAPDVMTLIEQQIENWDRGGRVTSTARLVSTIRTAIEEAAR